MACYWLSVGGSGGEEGGMALLRSSRGCCLLYLILEGLSEHPDSFCSSLPAGEDQNKGHKTMPLLQPESSPVRRMPGPVGSYPRHCMVYIPLLAYSAVGLTLPPDTQTSSSSGLLASLLSQGHGLQLPIFVVAAQLSSRKV